MTPEGTQAPAAPAAPSAARRAVEAFGRGLIALIEDVGGIAWMGARVLLGVVRPPFRVGLTFGQMDFLGVGSTLLVALTGLFTGMVFAKQSVSAFMLFNAESLVGPTVMLSITRELAPVFTALMITMRAGSAMCTEIGTMRVTEQIDALVTLAVDPIKYLVVPRVLAGLLMAPVLCIIFDLAGAAGTWAVAVWVEGLSEGTLLAKTRYYLDPHDVFEGLIKSAVFGTLVTLIACYKGYGAGGGSKGVGRATTQAMVMSAVTIFVVDYLLGLILIARNP